MDPFPSPIRKGASVAGAVCRYPFSINSRPIAANKELRYLLRWAGYITRLKCVLSDFY